jgi:nucleoside-diphosphate-sugar epimerase
MTPFPRPLARALGPEVLARLAADAVIVNVGLLIGLCARLLGHALAAELPIDDTSLHRMLRSLGRFYVSGAPLLTPIALWCFASFGLYSRGRFYTSRYKALCLGQAVTLAYLVFGFTTFFVPTVGPHPRSSLLVAWVATCGVMLVARFGAAAMTGFIRRELAQVERVPQALAPGAQVLIIGGAGYIGSVLTRRLLASGYRVKILDALFYGDASIAGLRADARVSFVKGDSRDVGAVVAAIRDVDAVVHLGEIVGDPATALDESLTIDINVAATRMIAEVCRASGVSRLVYASSCSVYGASDELLDEHSALNPVSIYAKAKIAAERAILSLQTPSFGPTILRFATVYGISPRPRFDLVVNLLAARATTERRIVINGGQQWRPFVHVADVGAAIIAVLEARPEAVVGEVFNVGSNAQNYRLVDLGEIIRRHHPGIEVTVNEGDVDRRNYRVCFDKIARRLGFTPARTVDDGVREISEAIAAGDIPRYTLPTFSNFQSLNASDRLAEIREARRIEGLADLFPHLAPERKAS